MSKKAELGYVIDSTNPDVVIGTETWSSSSISSREFFLPSTLFITGTGQIAMVGSCWLIKVLKSHINCPLIVIVKSLLAKLIYLIIILLY